MFNKAIYYYEATWFFDDPTNKNKTSYGFIIAEDWPEATAQLKQYYGSDLVKMSLEEIGFEQLLCCDSKETAALFKKAFMEGNS